MKSHLAKLRPTKKNHFGLSSIGARLFLAVMVAATIGLGKLGILFYQKLESVSILQMTTETNIRARELDAELKSSESFLKSLVAATVFVHNQGTRSPQDYENLVLSFMPARPHLITGFGIMQRPQGLVDRQWFGPYIEESQLNRGIPLKDDPRFSLVDLWTVDQYPQLQYYTDALKASSYFWSEPYLNDSYPVPLVTFAGSIHDQQGNVIAIMNGDINLKDLRQLEEISPSKNGSYYILTTKAGTLLSYSLDSNKAAKLENITSVSELNSVWNEVQRELDQGATQGYFKSDVTNSYWVYQQIPSNQWLLLQSVPYHVVITPALLGSIKATLIAGIILAVVVALFIRFLNNRLQPILDVCDATLMQDDVSPPPKDEIHRLSSAFFSMVERQNALVEQLRLMNAELIESHCLKDSFLANMSHELRTPLNAILGLTEGLQEGVFGTINTEQRGALRTIECSGSHLLDLISDILDLAKIESGQVDLDFTPTAVAPLCQSSLTFIQHQARKKGIQLEIKIPQNLPDVLANERRLRQVLINLLNNAVKFTPDHGLITLGVTLVPPQDELDQKHYLRIAVADTGIGIAAENITKLFQPFIQIDSSLNRKYEGTGLGLALVKRIVECHGGRVGVTSEVGRGSCFTIDLPCLPPDSPVLPVTLPQQTLGDNLIQPSDSPVIVLMDTPTSHGSSLSNYLRAKGYRLLLAKTGQEFITLVQIQQPDLIIVDLQIPGMDALALIRQIRQVLHLVDLPIITLTTDVKPGDRDRYLAAGASDYLTQPVKLKQLMSTMQRLLDRVPAGT